MVTTKFNFKFPNTLLLRANFEDLSQGVYKTEKYLVMFLSNLLLKEKHTLKNRDMHIQFAAHTPESSEKSSEKTSIGSEKSSEKILRLIQADVHITIKALAEQLGITTRAVEKNIAQLKSENRIERIGGNKGGQWKIMDEK